MMEGSYARRVKGGATEIEKLRQRSTPIAGRPGWRRTENGEEWYSATWLEEPDVDELPAVAVLGSVDVEKEIERLGAGVYDELADAIVAALTAIGKELEEEVERTIAAARQEIERELEGLRRTLASRTDHLA